MAVYKVSIVITGGKAPGAILNLREEPKVGSKITLGKEEFEVKEVLELMPARGEFHFLHVTCSPIKK